MKKIRLTALTMAGLMAAASMTGCGAKTAETTAASDNDSSRDDGGRDNNCGGDGWEGVPDQTACSIFKRLR